MSRIARLRRTAAAAVTLFSCACSAATDATPAPTSTPGLLPVRATFTPWPTPEIRDDQRLTLESRINEAADPQADMSLTVRGVQVIRNAVGGLDAIGEIRNNADTAQANVQVRVQLRSADGQSLAQKTILTARNVIGAGQTSPFRVHFSNPPAQLYGIDVVALAGDRIDSQRYAKIETRNVVAQNDGTRLTIRGELVNREPPITYTVQSGDSLLGIAAKLGVSVEQITADNPRISADVLQVGTDLTVQTIAFDVRVLATAYDAQRRVIGFRYIDVTQSTLASGAAIPFTATVLAATSTIAAYEVIAEAEK